MTGRTAISLAGLAGLVALVTSAPASALRCEGGLVDEGDRKYEVLRECGEPDFRDHPGPVFVIGLGFVPIEEDWYYNLGSDRLIRVLRFRDGRLVKIETGGYGFERSIRGKCEPGTIDRGMSKFELLLRCGEPAYRDSHVEFRGRGGIGRAPPPGNQVTTAVRIEEWSYDFGPNRFIRHVRIVDGEVRDVDTGERAD